MSWYIVIFQIKNNNFSSINKFLKKKIIAFENESRRKIETLKNHMDRDIDDLEKIIIGRESKFYTN